MISSNELPLSARILVRLLLGITIVFILIVTRQLLVPLFFAVLFAYALYPAANRLEGIGMPRFITNFVLIVSALLLIGALLFGFGLLIASFSEDLPEIQEQMSENFNQFKQLLESSLGITESQLSNAGENLQDFGQYIGEFFTATANTVLIIGLIPVYTFLILFYRNKFREFISRVFSSRYENIVQEIAKQTATVVPRYMKGLFVVCLILVFINSAGFYIIGIEYALLMGVIAAFFNLIPYLGTVIGYGLVFIFVLATQSTGLAFAVAIQFFIVQFFENNILTPNITGSYVQINPLVTIFSLIAGGMIWGLPGMFMVIPYLAILKIVCEVIPKLKPYSFLLGTRGTEQHLMTWADFKKRFKSG
ncbi:MAG: AI-2E family transporter [Balneolaceae bacterium]|nr:AI-2E family transporter [Balneolaceae bacterium]